MVGRTAAALASVACALVARPVSAQVLARLTVESFVLSSDTVRPRVDMPFHLILTLRVRERIDRVANLELPVLADVELLGDERQTIAGPRGSQYRETITVAAHQSGTIPVAPATLQAIDARDGRPKQWYSNGLTLVVVGSGAGAPKFPRPAPALVWWIVFLAAAAIVLALFFRWRRAALSPAAQPLDVPVPITFSPVARSPREQLQDALSVLRVERTRSAAVRVRSAVWRMLGASDGETLGDLLRHASPSGTMRELLVALERSAFTHDQDLGAAIEDACSALERQIGTVA